MRSRSQFRQSEITRALKGIRAAGIDVSRVEIEKDGRVVILTCTQQGVDLGKDLERNPWDEVLSDGSDKKRSP